MQLHFLNRKARVNEQDRVFLFVSLRTGKKRCKRSLHAAANGYATFGRNVNTDESLDKARGFGFQLGKSLNVGIAVSYSFL